MSVENLKQFVFRNKEVLMFIVGFGAMHIGWYNLQRNSTLNKAIAASREKETIKVSIARLRYIYITPFDVLKKCTHSWHVFYLKIYILYYLKKSGVCVQSFVTTPEMYFQSILKNNL